MLNALLIEAALAEFRSCLCHVDGQSLEVMTNENGDMVVTQQYKGQHVSIICFVLDGVVYWRNYRRNERVA